MTKPEIHEREEFLHMILQFKTEFPYALTDGEQICINQERGMLKRKLAYLNGEIEESEIPVYELPESITKKIKATISLIEKKGWTPKEDYYE